MKYWIFVTNADTWKTVREEQVWGTDVTTVKNVEKGDKAVVYVMETKKIEEAIPPRIKGLYEISSEPYEEYSGNFSKGGTYPNRVKLEPEIVLEELM